MDALLEKRVLCPYCNEGFTALIDTSEARQEYIEDCEVCCRPIQFSVLVADDELIVECRHENEC